MGPSCPSSRNSYVSANRAAGFAAYRPLVLRAVPMNLESAPMRHMLVMLVNICWIGVVTVQGGEPSAKPDGRQ